MIAGSQTRVSICWCLHHFGQACGRDGFPVTAIPAGHSAGMFWVGRGQAGGAIPARFGSGENNQVWPEGAGAEVSPERRLHPRAA